MHDEGGEVMRGSKRARLGGSAEEGFDHPKHEALAAAGEQHQNEDDDAAAVHHASLAAVVSRCPYLDTVNRRALDFDMEKACSITLARGHNIYACLVCGQFFQGRGKSTPMYTHRCAFIFRLYFSVAKSYGLFLSSTACSMATSW